MTEEQIREAGAAAVADFPPLTDETAARLGALLADLHDTPNGGAEDVRKEAA